MTTNMNENRTYILRLVQYKNALKVLKNYGFVRVFSDNLADALGVSAAQVRKDFSLFGISGNKKGGYQIDELLAKLNQILGTESMEKVIIIGCGRIGRALMHYKEYHKEGIMIVAGFDVNPERVLDAEVPIYHTDELPKYIKENQIKIAIIATPENVAQQVLDTLIDNGILGIMNFAPVHLRAPEDVVVQTINLQLELETVIYFANVIEKTRLA